MAPWAEQATVAAVRGEQNQGCTRLLILMSWVLVI